jgi:flagellar FliL protein
VQLYFFNEDGWMAKTDNRDRDEDGAAAPAAKSKSKNLIMIAGGAVLMLALTVGASVFITKSLMGSGDAGDGADSATAEGGHDKGDKADKSKKKGGKKDKKDAKEEAKPALYLALDPPFVVNSESGAGGVHYLQVAIEVQTREPEAVELVKKHMPVIRNNLILLLSSQTHEAVSTREGKEKLRAEALAEIQKILQQEGGKPGVEAVYFTNFVMQ